MPAQRSVLLREAFVAVLLAAAAVAVTVGAAMLSPAAGWIVGGVLGAAWAVVVVREAPVPRTGNQGSS